MKVVYQRASQYTLEDQYNMDEMGNYWQWWPDVSLTTCQLAGFKKVKKRVSVACCVSGAGEKLDFWIIGIVKKPRAFKGMSINSMGCHWTHNTKAWMMTPICKQ